MRYIVEIRRFGNLVQVHALDPETLREVSFQAPLGTSETTLRQLAAAKLAYTLRRKYRSPR
ncbi:MAG TPA: hypothetical protein VHL08_10590 [Dongiaceae bacterium]|jgi:hypothetical protein|nr:hypothetical protein [Dongiaceae bacterium]